MQVGIFRGDIKTLVDDIQELKPTVFVSVPRLLNRMHDKVCWDGRVLWVCGLLWVWSG